MDGLFSSMVARATLSPEDLRGLGALRSALSGAGYSEHRVRPLLGGADIPHRRYEEVPGYLERCRGAGVLGDLTALWLLWEPVSCRKIRDILEPGTVEVLVRLGLLREQDEHLVAEVDLYPCGSSFVLTDRKFVTRRFPNHVYELGKDSYVLARVTPRRRLSRALDLCTGSGVHAVMAAAHAREVHGVDLNPRALDFCRMNAALNGVSERCHFHSGDLYQPLGSQSFELVTANPPFLPTPEEGLELYRPGGETGEVVTEGIVRGLAEHLSSAGTLSLFTNYPLMRNSHVLDRFEQWLGGASGWGLALLDFGGMSPEAFIASHIGPPARAGYRERFGRWLESYHRLGIERVAGGNLFVRRLPAGSPGWRIQRSLALPERPLSAMVERWLDAAERFLAPGWEPDWNGWAPDLGQDVRLWVDPRQGDARVSFQESQWPEEGIGQEETELAVLLNGELTAGRVAELWAEEKGVSLEAARGRLVILFRRLGEKMVL